MTEYQPEDYIKYRIERARETITEVKTHLDNKFWNTAINRMYYACYYAVGALLVKHGIEVSSHSGVRQKFGQHFVKTGIIDRDLAKHYTQLFEKRQKSDYDDFLDYEEQDANSLYPKSVELIERIEQVLQEQKA
jgi:uncharacterized protein (UPF0332 family)